MFAEHAILLSEEEKIPHVRLVSLPNFGMTGWRVLCWMKTSRSSAKKRISLNRFVEKALVNELAHMK